MGEENKGWAMCREKPGRYTPPPKMRGAMRSRVCSAATSGPLTLLNSDSAVVMSPLLPASTCATSAHQSLLRSLCLHACFLNPITNHVIDVSRTATTQQPTTNDWLPTQLAQSDRAYTKIARRYIGPLALRKAPHGFGFGRQWRLHHRHCPP